MVSFESISFYILILFFILKTTKSYRPFTENSPWNTKIENPEIDPNSDKMILGKTGFAFNSLHINIEKWSIPVYYVNTSSVPLVRVHSVDTSGIGFHPDPLVPIPQNATPSLPQGGDMHMCIVDEEKQISWNFWKTVKAENGSWSCGVGSMTDLTSSGVLIPSERAIPWWLSVGSRATGFPLIAGLIRVEEVKKGVIPHALIFAYPYCRSEVLVAPASTSQNSKNACLPLDTGIPSGGRIFLLPEFDIEGSNLSEVGKIIARALRDYGAYMGDYADGAPIIYAESSPQSIKEWNEIGLTSDTLASVFTPEVLEKYIKVIKIPPVELGRSITVTVGNISTGFWTQGSYSSYQEPILQFQMKGNQNDGKEYILTVGSDDLGTLVLDGREHIFKYHSDLRDEKINLTFIFKETKYPLLQFWFKK